MNDVERYFTEADRQAIEAAVKEAELATGGEIVPYAVSRCGTYDSAAWRGATLGALLASVVAGLVFAAVDVWSIPLPYWVALPAVLGAAAGFLAPTLVPSVRRALVPAAELEARARERAATAFLHEEVFATRDRTGILILVALFERQVVVLGDSGINAKVEPRAWDAMVAAVVAGIRAGRPGEALAGAIRSSGTLLAEHGVARRRDDVDELDDSLRNGDVR